MFMTLFALIACSEKPTDDTAEEVEDTSSESDTEQSIDTGETSSGDTGPSEDTQDTNDSSDTDGTDDTNDTSDTQDTDDTEEPEPNPVYIGGYNTNVCFPKASPTGYGIGNISHDFTLTDQHGEQVSLSDFCGNTVLLVSSAFWCGACRGEAPELETLYQQYKNSNFTVITLLGENYQGQSPSIADLQQWASDFGITHPVLADVDFNTTASYLWANTNFNGQFYLPNMQLLSQGQVVEVSNDQLYESQIISYIQ